LAGSDPVPMSHALYYGSALLVSLLLGSLSAWWGVARAARGAIQLNAWRHDPEYGSTNAGLYVRARTQIAGPLALDRSEAIYFVADRDEQGEILRSDRVYRVEGGPFDARWWSITAYGDDHHLIPNRRNRYSYSSASITTDPDGRWSVRFSRTEQPGNWVPTGNATRFELFLRLYNPDPTILEDVRSVAVPRIIREEPTHG